MRLQVQAESVEATLPACPTAMGRAGTTLKLLKVAGPVGVALGGAGLYCCNSLDEGTRRALSMYAAFGVHASTVYRTRVPLPAPSAAALT